MTLIDSKIVEKVEKEQQKGTKFLTVSYDVPSENRKALKPEQKKDRLRRRDFIRNKFAVHGCMVNNSTYIVPTQKVGNLIDDFDKTYNDLQHENPQLSVIGTVYEDIARDILNKSINGLEASIRDEIEQLSAKVNSIGSSQNVDSVQKQQDRIRIRCYQLGEKIKIMQNRVEDLEFLDGKQYDDKRELCQNIDGDRRNLLRRV